MYILDLLKLILWLALPLLIGNYIYRWVRRQWGRTSAVALWSLRLAIFAAIMLSYGVMLSILIGDTWR